MNTKKKNIASYEHTENIKETRGITKQRTIINLVLNIIVIIMEIGALSSSFFYEDHSFFEFYTQDSNLLALVSCIICAIYLMRGLISGNYGLPKWVLVIKYMAVSCLVLTFTVVVFVLAPMNSPGGYKMLLFSGEMLFTHFLCPLITLAGFLVIDTTLLAKKSVLLAMIPTAIYAIVAITLNIMKIIEGPYPFLLVYEQPWWMSVIWFAVILLSDFALSWLVLVLSRKHANKFNMVHA